MNQQKIGKFIAEQRKRVGFTQMQLAEQLCITDRAVSKWETGKAMPDSSIMLQLCDALKINVNDLLCGEVVTMDNYNKELESNLFQLVKDKEESDKRLLRMEILVGVLCLLPLLASIIIAYVVPMEEWQASLIVLCCTLPLLISAPFMLRIEQKAGYYECEKCKHRYVPAYKNVLLAPHIHRTRYMKCPNCHEKSWHKKVLTKE